VNRGKRSLTLSLDRPEAQRIVKLLAARSDIVLENYKVGTLKRYGLDAGTLRKEYPRLIYCSLTGFGQDGPRREQAAYDFLIQAMGGLMSITGERDDRPGGGPQKVGVPIVDLMSGMYATVAMLAALARRERSGEGETIDIAMLDVQLGFLANQAMNQLLSGKAPGRAGNAHPNVQPQDVFPCRDGKLVLVVGNDGQFVKFCEVLGHPEWVTDERFAANPARLRNLAALHPLIIAELMKQDRAHWVAALEAVGVPCGPINDIAEAFADVQAKHRGMLFELPHPGGGKLPQVASPMRFTDAPLKHETPPPLLGQHTEEILAELDYKKEQIEELRSKGVI
jgi:crotonobetainyl-CoA:carnitine CoA-transferase CaiB-like acyl-CoA transferase